MSIIKPGFRGYAEIDSSATEGVSEDHKVRFSSFGINANQDVEAPEMVMGDDTHDAWAYGKIDVNGSISGPVTESTGVFIDALEANLVEDSGATINVKYYRGYTRTFTGCRLNQYTFTVNAGEVVNFTLDIIGVTVQPGPGLDIMSGYTKGEKLITWDKASIRVGDLHLDDNGTPNYQTLDYYGGLQSFTFTASNNFQRQFVLGRSDLFGDLVEGMKDVTGNIVSYEEKASEANTIASGQNFWDEYDGDYAYPISFYIGDNLIVSATVRFHRGTSDLGIGPVVTTMQFKGVTTHGRGNITQLAP
jgi:hypothetical protein